MKLIGKIQFTVVVFVISNLSSIQETMSSATPKTKTTHTNHSFYNVVKHDDQKGARYSYTTVNLKPHPDIEHYCKALNISKLDCNCDNIPSRLVINILPQILDVSIEPMTLRFSVFRFEYTSLDLVLSDCKYEIA